MTSQRALQVLKQKDETLSYAFQKGILGAMQVDWMEPAKAERLETRRRRGRSPREG